MVAREDHRHVAEHRLHHIGHPERLAGRLAEREGRLLERSLVQVAGPERTVAFLGVRHERFDRARGHRCERQEDEADADVEQGVRVRELARRFGGRAGHHGRERADERENERDAEELEGDVGDGHPLGLGPGAERRRERGDARADVRAEHDRHGPGEIEQPLVGEGEGEPERRRRRRHQRAEHRADEDADHRGVRDRGEKVHRERAGLEHPGVVEDQLEPEEQEPEPEEGLPDILQHPPAGDERGREAEADQERRIVGDAERDQLHRERRADVGAENHAERRPKGHEAGGDEADQHEGRGRGGLDDRGDRRAREDGQDPVAREPGQQAAQARAERPLERLATQADAVE